jgi:hypothetical protein
MLQILYNFAPPPPDLSNDFYEPPLPLSDFCVLFIKVHLNPLLFTNISVQNLTVQIHFIQTKFWLANDLQRMHLVHETSAWRSDVDDRLFSLLLVISNVRRRHIENVLIFPSTLFILHYLNKTRYIYELQVYVHSFGDPCVIMNSAVKYLERNAGAVNICIARVGCSAHSKCSNRLAGF